MVVASVETRKRDRSIENQLISSCTYIVWLRDFQ